MILGRDRHLDKSEFANARFSSNSYIFSLVPSNFLHFAFFKAKLNYIGFVGENLTQKVLLLKGSFYFIQNFLTIGRYGMKMVAGGYI